MNLTDLQVELRQLGDRLSQLHREIEKMKPKSEDEQQAAFASVNKLAAQAPLRHAALLNTEPSVKKTFVKSLAYLIVSAGQDVNARLLYLCRLALGIGCDPGLEASAEALYKAGLEFQAEDLRELAQLPRDLQYVFLVEALIAAHTAPESAPALYAAVADTAEIMQCDREELRVCAAVAKGRLLDDYDGLDDLPQPLRHKWSGKFADYLPDIWLSKRRVKCAELYATKYIAKSNWEIGEETRRKIGKPRSHGGSMFSFLADNMVELTDEYIRAYKTICPYKTLEPCSDIKQLCEAGTIVQPDQILVTYTSSEDAAPKKIQAPCAGAVFCIDNTTISEVIDPPDKYDKYLAVYVVSPFDTYAALSSEVSSKKPEEDDEPEKIDEDEIDEDEM